MDLKAENNWLELKRKYDYYFSRVIERPLCPPEHVYFSLTNRCNLKCRMCGIPHCPGGEDGELTTEECKRIINQIADLGINHLIFSGGEPLLRKDIFELIAHAVSRKIKMVDMISNGLLMNEKTAQRLAAIGLNHVTISIDGLEQVDDFIRGKGAFQKAVEAIDIIKKHAHGFPTVGINFTIMDCNIDDILPMIETARNKKCNIIVLQPILSDNTDMSERKKNELWVSEKNIPKLEKIMKEVLNLKRVSTDLLIHVDEKILEMMPAYFSGKPLGKNIKCYEGIVRIVITCGGDLWSCRGLYGNLRKKSLKECWFSLQANKIRQSVKGCQNHCLQSCILLPELSDIYKGAHNRKYSDKIIRLFGGYNFKMIKRKNVALFENMFKRAGKNDIEGLNGEIRRAAKFIRELRSEA